MRLLLDIIKTQPNSKYRYVLIHNNQEGIYVDYLIIFNEDSIDVYVWIRLHGVVKRYIIDDLLKEDEMFDPYVFYSNVAFFINKIERAKEHNELDKVVQLIRENFIIEPYYRSLKTYNFLIGLQTHKRFNFKKNDPYYQIKTPKIQDGPAWDILDRDTFYKIKSIWHDKDTFNRIKFTRCVELMLSATNIRNLSDKIYDLGYPSCALITLVDEFLKNRLLYTSDNLVDTCRLACEWFIKKTESNPNSLYDLCLQKILEYDIDTEPVNHLYLPDLPLDNLQIIEI